jgi:hypothetical protein
VFRLTKTIEAEDDDVISGISGHDLDPEILGDGVDVYKGTWEGDLMHGFGVYTW